MILQEKNIGNCFYSRIELQIIFITENAMEMILL